LTFEPEISQIQVSVISKKSFLGLLNPEDEGTVILSNIINNSTWHNMPDDLYLPEHPLQEPYVWFIQHNS
jgi:hypothetical protein